MTLIYILLNAYPHKRELIILLYNKHSFEKLDRKKQKMTDNLTESELIGKWVLESSDNFEAFLIKLGKFKLTVLLFCVQ